MQVVIFDLDDTLISEKQYIESGYRVIASELEQRFAVPKQSGPSSYEIYEKLMELLHADTKNVFNRLFEEYAIPYTKEDIGQLVQKYRSHRPEISFYEDVTPVLTRLRAMGMKLAIISDGYAITQRNKIEVLHADQYFDRIILTDELGREFWKPNARAFEILQQEFQVPFEDMVYIGDNPEKDFYIRKTYPIHTVRMIRPDAVYDGRQYLEGIQEERRITRMDELL